MQLCPWAIRRRAIGFRRPRRRSPQNGSRTRGSTRDRWCGPLLLRPNRGPQSVGRIERRGFAGANSEELVESRRFSLRVVSCCKQMDSETAGIAARSSAKTVWALTPWRDADQRPHRRTHPRLARGHGAGLAQVDGGDVVGLDLLPAVRCGRGIPLLCFGCASAWPRSRILPPGGTGFRFHQAGGGFFIDKECRAEQVGAAVDEGWKATVDQGAEAAEINRMPFPDQRQWLGRLLP